MVKETLTNRSYNEIGNDMQSSKKVEYKFSSRRQMWQTFQHLRKSLDYAKAIRAEVLRNDAPPVIKNSAEELVTLCFVSIGKLNKLCVENFGCKLDKLEVYK